MKRVAVGDVHLTGFEQDALDSSGRPLRLGYIFRALDEIMLFCRKNNVRNVDFLGDLIHDKTIIYTTAQTEFVRFLLRNQDINFTIISGNHDMSSTGETQQTAIEVFKPYANVRCVLYSPEMIDGILYVPYTSKFLEIVRDLPSSKIMISHLGLNEAMLQSGLSKVDKISIKDLQRFNLVLLGHYHKPQHIQQGNTNVYYAGSVIHKDWNDKNEKKRFLMYDTETLEVTSHDINGIPEYREYVIRTNDDIVRIQKEISIAQEQGHNCRVRNLMITDKAQELEIQQQISTAPIIFKKQEIDPTNRGIDISFTHRDRLLKYLEINKIPKERHEEYIKSLADDDILKV